MRKRLVAVLMFISLIGAGQLFAQDSAPANEKPLKFPHRFLSSIDKKTTWLENKLSVKSEKSLRRLRREENRLRKKLFKKDSVVAKQLFDESLTTFQTLKSQLKQKGKQAKEYLPFLDTLKTSLKFLQQDNNFLKGNPAVSKALEQVEGLENKLQQAQQVQQFLKNRRQYLKAQLGKYGLAKELKKYNKEVYYYTQQVNEYKAVLQDPKKLERKAIELLSNTKVFQDFMSKNSFLASIFSMPGGASQPSPTGEELESLGYKRGCR